MPYRDCTNAPFKPTYTLDILVLTLTVKNGISTIFMFVCVILNSGCGSSSNTIAPTKIQVAAKQEPIKTPDTKATDDSADKLGVKAPDGRELTKRDFAKVNKDNFLKITLGMSEADVHLILGKPLTSQHDQIFDTDRWVGNDGKRIVIHYKTLDGGFVVATKEQEGL